MHTISTTAKQIQINIWLLAANEGRYCIDFGFLSTCMSLKIGAHLNTSEFWSLEFRFLSQHEPEHSPRSFFVSLFLLLCDLKSVELVAFEISCRRL